MDVLAEYADRYGAPHRDTSWHEIIALVKRSTRFQVRDRLVMADGQTLGRPVEAADAGVRSLLRAKLDGIAWPGGV